MLYKLHKNTPADIIIQPALQSLRKLVANRLDNFLQGTAFSLPAFLSEDDGLEGFCKQAGTYLPSITIEESIVLLLGLVPHIDPGFFSSIMTEHLPNGGDFPEFGGVKGGNHRGLLPTGETAQFVLYGTNQKERLTMQGFFSEGHLFYRNDVLSLETVQEGEPLMSGRILVSSEWVERLLNGKEQKPRFSVNFPAKLTTTKMIWSDLVLHPYTAEQIEDIKRWVRYHHLVEADENLSRKITAGYRVLFYGPPGTGKTLTAALIGKEFGKDVYRIDLSQIVSKYIGETEKNLNKIFDKAQHKDWLLFFDEADALFGKRTSVQSSHDKYANQEVSFLLQRIEEFGGLMILASNFKSNIDDAFLRRFHSIIHFPMPNAQERLKLWTQSLPQSVVHNSNLDLKQLADSYEISGASIINAVHYATLKSLSRETPVLEQEDLVNGVRKELLKEEKSV